ncbi:MAG TPA: hypothetical protein VMF90_13330 [Rhizobiaceae bacterium]|nr:hypothetical protein [Rhizobiaceae bacterium]
MFPDVAYPEQLTVLTSTLNGYCRERGITPGTPDYEAVAREIMSLFQNGFDSEDTIRAMLDQERKRA